METTSLLEIFGCINDDEDDVDDDCDDFDDDFCNINQKN